MADPFTVLVCGGRSYADRNRVYSVLGRIHEQRPISALIEGGAPGADTLARSWATLRGIPCRTYRADWRTHGRAAGPIRNALMLASEPVDLVIAFPGGAGTADMIRKARAAGVDVGTAYPCG